MRRPFIFLLPVILGQCVDGSMPALMNPVPNQRIKMFSEPLALDTTLPNRRQVGALTLTGAWSLTSDSRNFGGFSALDVNGNQVTALSDAGTLLRFRLGRFGNASGASLVRVPEQCGHVARKYDNDTESLTHDLERQHWWIGFEWRNVVCRTDSNFSRSDAVFAPAAIASWPQRAGPESMTMLQDGRFLLIAEDGVGGGGISPLVLFDRDPTDPAAVATTIAFRPPAGFKPTDVAQLPDSRLLVLTRRFALWSLFTSKLVLLDPIAPKPVGTLQGRVIAHFEPPVLADNFEGLSVTVEDGKPIIWIISDDNYMRWQRTLLLKFALN